MDLKKISRELSKMHNLVLGIVLIGLGAVAMWYGGQKASDGLKTVFRSDKAAIPTDLFHVTVTSMVRFKFPGPLLYFYDSYLFVINN